MTPVFKQKKWRGALQGWAWSVSQQGCVFEFLSWRSHRWTRPSILRRLPTTPKPCSYLCMCVCVCLCMIVWAAHGEQDGAHKYFPVSPLGWGKSNFSIKRGSAYILIEFHFDVNFPWILKVVFSYFHLANERNYGKSNIHWLKRIPNILT